MFPKSFVCSIFDGHLGSFFFGAVVMLWTFFYMSFSEHANTFPTSIHMSSFSGYLFILHHQCMKVPGVVPSGPCQHLVLSIFHCNHSDGCIVVSLIILVCTLQKINEIEHLDILYFQMFSFIIFKAYFQTCALNLAERKCLLTLLS